MPVTGVQFRRTNQGYYLDLIVLSSCSSIRISSGPTVVHAVPSDGPLRATWRGGVRRLEGESYCPAVNMACEGGRDRGGRRTGVPLLQDGPNIVYRRARLTDKESTS